MVLSDLAALDYPPGRHPSSSPRIEAPGTVSVMLRDDLGRRIRDARLALGLTQREAAERSGVSYQLISQIERGAVNTTVDTVAQICEQLGLEVDVHAAQPTVSESRRALAERFLAVLPALPQEDLDVFVHEIALWERRYGAK